MGRTKLIAVSTLLAVGAALLFYVKPTYFNSETPEQLSLEELSAAPHPLYVIGGHEGENGVVVNLERTGERSTYAKIQIALAILG